MPILQHFSFFSHRNVILILGTQQRSALSYSKDTPSKFNIGISTGSMGSNRSSRQGGSSYHPNGVARKTASTTTNVTPSSNVDYVPPYYRPNGPTDLDGKSSVTSHGCRGVLEDGKTRITNISSRSRQTLACMFMSYLYVAPP